MNHSTVCRVSMQEDAGLCDVRCSCGFGSGNLRHWGSSREDLEKRVSATFWQLQSDLPVVFVSGWQMTSVFAWGIHSKQEWTKVHFLTFAINLTQPCTESNEFRSRSDTRPCGSAFEKVSKSGLRRHGSWVFSTFAVISLRFLGLVSTGRGLAFMARQSDTKLDLGWSKASFSACFNGLIWPRNAASDAALSKIFNDNFVGDYMELRVATSKGQHVELSLNCFMLVCIRFQNPKMFYPLMQHLSIQRWAKDAFIKAKMAAPKKSSFHTVSFFASETGFSLLLRGLFSCHSTADLPSDNHLQPRITQK